MKHIYRYIIVGLLISGSTATAMSSEDKLIDAVIEGDLPAICTALENGANADTTDALGDPAIAIAILEEEFSDDDDESIEIDNNTSAIVLELLCQGADPNAKTNDGTPLLLLAIEHQKLQAANHLLTFGAHPNQTDQNNTTPLIEAVINNFQEITHTFLRHRSPINHADNNQWTALAHALKQDNEQMVQILLNAGADHTIKAGGNIPLLCVAAQARRPEHLETPTPNTPSCIQQLIAKNADIIETDPHGNNALDLALKSNVTQRIQEIMLASSLNLFKLLTKRELTGKKTLHTKKPLRNT